MANTLLLLQMLLLLAEKLPFYRIMYNLTSLKPFLPNTPLISRKDVARAILFKEGLTGYKFRSRYSRYAKRTIEKAVREITPVLNDKGSPIDENGNPTVSGGSPSAGTAKAKAKEAVTA